MLVILLVMGCRDIFNLGIAKVILTFNSLPFQVTIGQWCFLARQLPTEA